MKYTSDWKPQHPMSWEQYRDARRIVFEPDQPGEPYAIIAPPYPMWEVWCKADGLLETREIALLRARRIRYGEYRANGGWVGTHWAENWEYMRADSDISAIIPWNPVYKFEWVSKEDLRAAARWGAVLGIANREFNPDDWEQKRVAFVEAVGKENARREKARAYAAARKAKTAV